MNHATRRVTRRFAEAPSHRSQDFLPWDRVHTFSIAAADPSTGEAGVGTASRHVAIGAIVPFAEAGAGAVATQGVVSAMYGIRGLELMRKKVAPSEVMRRLTGEDITITADDPKIFEFYAAEGMTKEGSDFLRDPERGRILWFNRRIRQVAMVDSQGRSAVHDGGNFPVSESLAGEGFACIGGKVASGVVPAMAKAFERARSERKTMLKSLLAALQAGEEAGGDRRGNTAAALLVVREKGHWSGTDRFCDVRVDEDDQAISKLARLTEHYEPT